MNKLKQLRLFSDVYVETGKKDGTTKRKRKRKMDPPTKEIPEINVCDLTKDCWESMSEEEEEEESLSGCSSEPSSPSSMLSISDNSCMEITSPPPTKQRRIDSGITVRRHNPEMDHSHFDVERVKEIYHRWLPTLQQAGNNEAAGLLWKQYEKEICEYMKDYFCFLVLHGAEVLCKQWNADYYQFVWERHALSRWRQGMNTHQFQALNPEWEKLPADNVPRKYTKIKIAVDRGLGDIYYKNQSHASYNEAVFVPMPKCSLAEYLGDVVQPISSDQINMWTDFAVTPWGDVEVQRFMQCLDDVIVEIDPILQHIWAVIAGRDDINSLVFMDYVVDILKRPHRQNILIPVMRGKSGIGKGIIFDAISKIIGAAFCKKLATEEDLFSEFNDWHKHSLLTVFEEAEMSGKHVEKMRAHSSCEYTLFNKKFGDIMQLKNINRMIPITNHIRPTGEIAGGRRLLDFNCSLSNLYPNDKTRQTFDPEEKKQYCEMLRDCLYKNKMRGFKIFAALLYVWPKERIKKHASGHNITHSGFSTYAANISQGESKTNPVYKWWSAVITRGYQYVEKNDADPDDLDTGIVRQKVVEVREWKRKDTLDALFAAFIKETPQSTVTNADFFRSLLEDFIPPKFWKVESLRKNIGKSCTIQTWIHMGPYEDCRAHMLLRDGLATKQHCSELVQEMKKLVDGQEMTSVDKNLKDRSSTDCYVFMREIQRYREAAEAPSSNTSKTVMPDDDAYLEKSIPVHVTFLYKEDQQTKTFRVKSVDDSDHDQLLNLKEILEGDPNDYHVQITYAPKCVQNPKWFTPTLIGNSVRVISDCRITIQNK